MGMVTPLAIGDLILVEVMQGFRNQRDCGTWQPSARLQLLLFSYRHGLVALGRVLPREATVSSMRQR